MISRFWPGEESPSAAKAELLLDRKNAGMDPGYSLCVESPGVVQALTVRVEQAF